MPSLADLREFLAYNRWAHDAFFDAALALPPGAVDREVGGSFPSLRATLAHMVWAEWLWIERWEGGDAKLPDGWEGWGVAELRRMLGAVAARQDAFVDGLSDGESGRELRYRDRAGNAFRSRIDHMLVHVVNHATYHRGQLAAQFRLLGHVPPSTDFVKYTRATASEEA
jgi:uncharacterized damage-inducible protein DinB